MGDAHNVQEYCSCGAMMEGEVDPSIVDDLEAAWDMIHSGDGHEPCAREEAVEAMEDGALMEEAQDAT